MNKYFLLLLLFSVTGIHAEELEASSEVVDLMAPMETVKEDSSSLSWPDEVTLQEPPAELEMAPIPSSPAARTPVPTTTADLVDPADFNPRKSHWLTTFGFEMVEYRVPLNFVGEKENFQDQRRQLYGGRLGVGGEIYLGRNFNTTTKFEGFYMGTLFESATPVGSEEVSVEFASVKKTGHIWGGEVNQSLSYIFDMKTRNPFMGEMTYLTVEPFIFAGIGMARAYNRLNYQYDNSINEAYQMRIEDNMTITSWGAGFNFTSNNRYFLYIKATQYSLNITRRTEDGFSRRDGEARVPINRSSRSANTDPVMIYALGGGYKF
jgi:hypothetical protein